MKLFNTLTLLFLVLSASFISCNTSDKSLGSPVQVDKGIASLGPYLTRDNKQNAVLCWTAKDPSDSLYRLKFSVFDSIKNRFGETITVTPSKGCSNSPESMSKVAFKNDGTIVAVFARKFPNEINPYAGAIYYTISRDSGRSWEQPLFLHSDSSHHYGRNFFDLETLTDGEVAAVWLDGRFGKTQKGSALFFAKTLKGKGFAKDSCLNRSTCECCRTDLLVDNTGILHVAYRSIMFPPATMGAQVRDMVYICSRDNGKTFSSEKVVSNDNWKIDGCPHSGPSLAVSNGKVNAIWFSAAEGKAGLYLTSSVAGNAFQKRIAINVEGRHPQLSIVNHQLVSVYEEAKSENVEMHDAQHGAMSSHHPNAAAARILLNIIEKNTPSKTFQVTDGKFADHHAVIAEQNHRALIAWVREERGLPSVYYTIKDLTNEE